MVHAHGTLTVRDDERFVRGVVGRLLPPAWPPRPGRGRCPTPAPDFIDGMLRQIVGIEIAVTALVGKRKLGQNKDARDRLGAADALEARGHTALARRMREAG